MSQKSNISSILIQHKALSVYCNTLNLKKPQSVKSTTDVGCAMNPTCNISEVLSSKSCSRSCVCRFQRYCCVCSQGVRQQKSDTGKHQVLWLWHGLHDGKYVEVLQQQKVICGELCCFSFWIFSWTGCTRFAGFILVVFLCVFVCVCSV